MANFQKINQFHVPKMTSSASQEKLLDKKNKHLTPQKVTAGARGPQAVLHQALADARGPGCSCARYLLVLCVSNIVWAQCQLVLQVTASCNCVLYCSKSAYLWNTFSDPMS